MRIGLYIKEELNETDIATYVISKINEYGFDFDNDNPNVVIYIGGDGTFLRAVNEYLSNVNNIIFVGINEGTLGFYPHFVIDDLDEIMHMLQNEDYAIESHLLMKAALGDEVFYAVNEIRIENPFHTLISKVYIDDQYFETFRGNGLSICTSNGSSAYNKSLGGSVVSSKLQTLQLTEIAPINNRVYRSINSSIILSRDESITLEGDFSEAVIGYDHLTTSSDYNRIKFSLSEKMVNIVVKKDYEYINKIHDTFIK